MVSGSMFTYLHKSGSAERWDSLQNYIPPDGEIIIYDADENHPSDRLKRGNGHDLPRDLPFIDGDGGESTVAKKVEHALIFGNGEAYRYDGSAEVVVPVYTGEYETNN